MIDPIGDATHIGRRIEDSFERSITLQWAQALKQEIEQQNFSYTVIITRTAGDTVPPLQNAHYANRLNVHLYITLSCFQTTDATSLYLFRFSSGNDMAINPNTLALIAYNQAHRLYVNTSHTLAHTIQTLCKQDPINLSCAIHGPYALPFKPLIGIATPQLGFELGLLSKNDWRMIVEPLAQALIMACSQYTGAVL